MLNQVPKISNESSYIDLNLGSVLQNLSVDVGDNHVELGDNRIEGVLSSSDDLKPPVGIAIPIPGVNKPTNKSQDHFDSVSTLSKENNRGSDPVKAITNIESTSTSVLRTSEGNKNVAGETIPIPVPTSTVGVTQDNLIPEAPVKEEGNKEEELLNIEGSKSKEHPILNDLSNLPILVVSNTETENVLKSNNQDNEYKLEEEFKETYREENSMFNTQSTSTSSDAMFGLGTKVDTPSIYQAGTKKPSLRDRIKVKPKPASSSEIKEQPNPVSSESPTISDTSSEEKVTNQEPVLKSNETTNSSVQPSVSINNLQPILDDSPSVGTSQEGGNVPSFSVPFTLTFKEDDEEESEKSTKPNSTDSLLTQSIGSFEDSQSSIPVGNRPSSVMNSYDEPKESVVRSNLRTEKETEQSEGYKISQQGVTGTPVYHSDSQGISYNFNGDNSPVHLYTAPVNYYYGNEQETENNKEVPRNIKQINMLSILKASNKEDLEGVLSDVKEINEAIKAKQLLFNLTEQYDA